MKQHWLSAMVLCVLLLVPAVTVAGQLNIVGTYAGEATTLSIATYSEGNEIIALLGISRKVSITFTKQEWNAFLAMWHQAENARGGSFDYIGSYKETGTTYQSLLTMSAGPGVQLTINDQAGTYTYTLSPDNYPSFDADILRVNQALGCGPDSCPDETPSTSK